MIGKILVVDNDKSVRRMVGRVLDSEGYEVALAEAGAEALTRFREGQPDLVILDLNPPTAEGWSSFEELTHLNPSIPVVIISAFANQAEEANRRGSPVLMEKPLDLALLLQTIDDLLLHRVRDGVGS